MGTIGCNFIFNFQHIDSVRGFNVARDPLSVAAPLGFKLRWPAASGCAVMHQTTWESDGLQMISVNLIPDI